MGHHHHHSHHGSGSGIGFVALVIATAILGLTGWGSIAIGVALGLTGAAAFFAGAGIIVGGLLAVGAVALGIYGIVSACQNISRTRSYYKTPTYSVVQSSSDYSSFGTNTNSINQSLGVDNIQVAATSSSSVVSAPAVAQQPAKSSWWSKLWGKKDPSKGQAVQSSAQQNSPKMN